MRLYDTVCAHRASRARLASKATGSFRGSHSHALAHTIHDMIPSIGPSDSEKKITKKYKRMVDLQKAYVTKRVLDDETATSVPSISPLSRNSLTTPGGEPPFTDSYDDATSDDLPSSHSGGDDHDGIEGDGGAGVGTRRFS